MEWSAGGRRQRERIDRQCTGRDGLGDFGQTTVVVPGEVAQTSERRVHIEAAALGDHPLRLFDRDSALQRVLQVAFANGCLSCRLVLKDRDAGDIRESLPERDIGVRQTDWFRQEQIQATQDHTLESEWDRAH